MTRYWIGVAHRAHALRGQEYGFCAFSHGKEAAVAKLGVNDQFIYYAPKEAFEGAAVQAFVALGTVTGEAPRQAPFPQTDFTAWMRDASYEAIREIPVRPMLEDLSFVRSPRNWGMAFRRSLFEIGVEDFERIAIAMRS